MKAKITKRIVDSTTADKKTGDITLWDTEVTRFCVRFRATGGKFYALKARVNGKQRWITIGRHGSPWAPEEARKEAVRLLGEIAAGKDPANERAEDKVSIDMKELCTLYLAEGCAMKKASTLASDHGRINRHIIPLLGKMRVKDVTRADVERFQSSVAEGKTATTEKTEKSRATVTGGKGVATRTMGLLGGIFTFAVERGMRPDNPVHGVKKFKENRFERFLTVEELKALGETLKKAEKEGENAFAIAAIRLLILTGCRKNEILSLKWEHIDFERNCLRLPDSKTGAKVVPMGQAAIDLFNKLPRHDGNPYVLVGDKEGSHFVALQKIWVDIRTSAGLPDLRLHDLRHSFASVGAGSGHSLLMIGALLGHKDAKTTARYAHLAADPVKEAADTISKRIAEVLG